MTSRHPDEMRCAYSWCTTLHGQTTHPDDEDHRSAGVEVPVFAPSGTRDQPLSWEVGLLRRRTDVETWFVIEDHGQVILEITVDSARRLLRAFVADPALSALIDDAA